MALDGPEIYVGVMRTQMLIEATSVDELAQVRSSQDRGWALMEINIYWLVKEVKALFTRERVAIEVYENP